MATYIRRPVRRMLCAALAAVVALAGCAQNAPVAAPSPVDPRPNVLVILADDLGYSDLGAFGSEIPTPNLDRLATEGRILTNHYVAPTCSPTRAMLLSGSDHHVAGLGSMGEIASRDERLKGKRGYEGYLHERVLWLPELMRDAGYHTYMVGKWHLGGQPGRWPNDRGFERSFALLQGGGSHFAPVPGKPLVSDGVTWVEDKQRATLPPDFYSSNSLTDKMLAYLGDGRDSRPFFAYVAYTAPHWPLMAPDADIAKFKGWYDVGPEVIRQRRLERQRQLGLFPATSRVNAGIPESPGYPSWKSLSEADRREDARKMEVYAAMVHNMDRNIGRIVEHLKKTGRYENTLILFQSDNGAEASPSFYPNNENTDNSVGNLGRPLSNTAYGPRWAEVSSTPYRLFKGYMTQGGAVAAAIVRLPRQSRPLPAFSTPTHVTDVAPTVLAAAGVKVPTTTYRGRTVEVMSGRNVLGALASAQEDPQLRDRAIASELFGGRYVRQGKWKLVSVQTPFSDSSWELFDLEADCGETTNVAGTNPELVSRLARTWEEYAKQTQLVHAPIRAMPRTERNATRMNVDPTTLSH